MICIDGTSIQSTLFPDNTVQVWRLPDWALIGPVHISWYYQTLNEFFELAQLKRLLDGHGVQSTLYIDYLPFARQDKNVSNDACFGLFPFAEMLNNLEFQRVTILDPHSNVALQTIDRSTACYPLDEVKHAVHVTKADKIVYPDHGALVKYMKLYNYPYAWANKERDAASGEVLSVDVVGQVAGQRLLIVDDICDGGATFIHLAEALYNAEAYSVDLFVTHGLFTKGLDVLRRAGIQNIYTAKGKVYERRGQVVTREDA